MDVDGGIERPQKLIIRFEIKNFNEQTYDASIFDVINVAECYCNIGLKFYPEQRIIFKCGAINYNEAYKEILNFNKNYNCLHVIIKPYINQSTFKSAHRIYVFGTR